MENVLHMYKLNFGNILQTFRFLHLLQCYFIQGEARSSAPISHG